MTVAAASLAPTGRPLLSALAASADDPTRYLPDAMRGARRFLLHDADKRPFYVSGRPRHGELDGQADLEQLASLEDALAAQRRRGERWGIGFALGFDPELGHHWQGIDFDHLVDDAGSIAQQPYARVYQAADSYAERSPSGDGLHIIGLGRAFQALRWPPARGRGAPGIECYSAGRYFTVTGDVMRQAEPRDLADLVERLRAVLAERPSEQIRAVVTRRARPAAASDSTAVNIEAYCRAHPLEGELERFGFRRIGSRWLSPRSSSGVPGVHVHDGHAVSFHASDAGLGTACGDGQAVVFDSFDLAVAAQFGGDRRRALRELLPRMAAGRTARTSSADTGSQSNREPAAPSDPAAPRPLPQAAADSFVNERYLSPSGPALVYWQAGFHAWNGSHYEPVPDPDIRSQLYAYLGTGARKRQVDEVLDALRARVNLSNRHTPPQWVPRLDGDPEPAGLVPMGNGLLRLADRALLPASSRLFVAWGLPFDYDGAAAAPRRWLAFLDQLWHGDEDSKQLLREWFGYCLSGSTAQQKALLLVGPKRSGKGTIGRVLTHLMGAANVVSPTLASLGTTFGLQPLIGKTLVLVSDARLSGQADVSGTVENILRITGEDCITIPRKFLPDYTATLSTRIVVLSNEAPRFTDASGALPSRFLVLTTSASFYGQESPTLSGELLAELPGIFAWALAGLDALRARGHFVQPAAGAELMDDMDRLASPVRAFIDERCVVSPGADQLCADLFSGWCEWCAENGRKQAGTLQTFSRDLRAACSSVRTVQARVEHSSRRVRRFSGIRLRTAADDLAADCPGEAPK